MNQKGFTTVEVLVCFVIVSVVMMSLFSTISSFNEKKIEESYRARVYEFKNGITNMIQEDIIKRGLTFAKVSDNGKTPGDVEGRTYTVDMTFRDGSKRRLIVHQRFSRTAYRLEGTDRSDDFYIEYGTPSEGGSAGDMIRYNLPELGENKGYYSTTERAYIPEDNSGRCYKNLARTQSTTCLVSKNFQINNIAINVSNEQDPDAESHVLNIYVGFYHPNLGTKYAINIIAPIDYQTSSVDQNGQFPTTPTNRNSATEIYYP
ncbi:MAG: prepilin-type N-terminal cleavage/methylation domain-containing protein [Bacilli bacterium]|nr:prepilin-type N-terminal cleavage/methylation domain-containing protein [Bacilli bacterium]